MVETDGAIEMQKLTEGPLPHRLEANRHGLAVDNGLADVPFGSAVAAGRALEQLVGGRDRLADGRLRERIGRVVKVEPRRVGNFSQEDLLVALLLCLVPCLRFGATCAAFPRSIKEVWCSLSSLACRYLPFFCFS